MLSTNLFKKLSFPKTDLTGKFALVTGGNDGIGFHTALELAKLNCSVTIVGRSQSKSQEAVDRIRSLSGNQSVQSDIVDLGNFESISQFTQRFASQHNRLDYLINNAGAKFYKFQLTADGLESTVQVNHLGPLRLTLDLLPLINQTDNSRIVFLSSFVHYNASLTLPDDLHTDEQSYRGSDVYAKTKLMNVLTANRLQRHVTNPTAIVCSVDPGFVATNFTYATLPNSVYGWVFQLVMKIAHRALGRTPNQGAMTSMYVTTTDGIKTGGYYSSCELTEPSKLSQDEQLMQDLWHRSLQMIESSDRE